METFNQRSRFLTWIVGGCVIIASTFGAATGANAQELITNGNFSNGLTGWSQESWAGGSVFGINANGPTDTSAASGNYAYAGGGTYNLLTQNVTVTTGSAYRLSFLAGSKSGQGAAYGYLQLRQGADYNAASFIYNPSDAAFGSYTVDFVAGATSIGVWLRSDAGTYAAYDNVSVTPIASVANAMNYSSASGYSVITSALTGSGKVTSNAGTGGLTLSAANTYTGGTEVTGGTLFVTGTGTLGAASGSVTVSGAGQLDLRNQQIRTGTIAMVGQDARIISGDVNNPGSIVNNGVAFQFGGGQLSVPLSGSAGMNVTGGGSITGSNSYAGPTTITTTPGWYGTNTFFVDNANALGAASADLTILGGLVSLQNNTVTRTGNVTISGGQVLSGTFSKPSGAYDVQGGQIGVVLAGAAGVTKSGTGTAILTGANTYTGTTTVSLGTLLIGSGGTSGSIAGNIVNNASLIFNRSDALTYAGLISGTGSVTKQGAGTLTLTGSSTYSGPTAISSGALAVNGSIASAVNVANAATLGGAGTINGLVTVAGGGILAPGNSPGTLTMTAGLSLADASILNFELVATDATVGGGINDLIVVNGNFLLDGVLNVAGTGDFSTVANYTKWRLFNYSGGTFTDGVLTLGTMPSVGASGKFFQIDTATAGQVNLVIVPEPGALALAGFGIAAAWALRRRLKKPGAEATG